MGNFFSKKKTNKTNSHYNEPSPSYNKNKNKYHNNKNFEVKILDSEKIYNFNLNFNNKIYKIDKEDEIIFKNSYNDIIDENSICILRKFNRIIFGFSFNQEVKNKFSSNVIYIQFGHNFNKSINFMIIEGEEDNIQELILGEKFNHPVDNLPPRLKKISFGYEFNYPVNNLPNSIEYIKFGNNFNQNIDYLPCSLINIILGNNFNYNIDNIPSSIQFIEIGKNFNKSINNVPLGLKKIKFEKNYYENNKEYLDKIFLLNEFIEISF